jgi:PKD repeat protein
VVSDEQYIFQARNGTVSAVLISLLPTGFLRVRSTSSNNLWTSTAAVPLGSYVKIAAAFDFAGGRFKAGLLTPGTLNQVAAGGATDWVTTALSSTSIDSFQIGHVSSNADATPFVIDEVRWDPAGTDYIPAGTAMTVDLNVSPASGPAPLAVTATTFVNGAIGTKTYAFNWGDGQTTAAQASTTATHTYAAAGTYTVTVTVPDN